MEEKYLWIGYGAECQREQKEKPSSYEVSKMKASKLLLSAKTFL